MRLSLSIISMVAAFCALTAFLYLLRFNAKRKKPRPPFTQDSRPGPGQSLLVELDVINETLRCYSVFAVVSPATIFGDSGPNLSVSVGELWSKLDRGMVVVQPTHARAVFFVQCLDSLAVHIHQFGLLQWQWLEGTCSGDDRAGWHDPA